MKRVWIIVTGFILGGILTYGLAFAFTPMQLKNRLIQESKVTIIDIRNRALFAGGHIQGAINIPASIIAKKRLPAIGTVVVYGDGARTDLTIKAVNTLNAKRGIQAEILEGGYSAWEAMNLSTTQESGLSKKKLDYLSYSDLKSAVAKNSDIVLVDMRRTSRKAQGVAMTDFSAMFPGVRRIRLNRRLQFTGEGWDISNTHNLYVLIGDGGGHDTEKVAYRLKAAGIRRVAILIGGELILRRMGER